MKKKGSKTARFLAGYFLMLPMLFMVHAVMEHSHSDPHHELSWSSESSDCDVCDLYLSLSATIKEETFTVPKVEQLDLRFYFVPGDFRGCWNLNDLRGPPSTLIS